MREKQNNGPSSVYQQGQKSRRQFLKIVRTVGIGAAAYSLLPIQTLHGQSLPDPPTDCFPIGSAGKTPAEFRPNPGLPVRVRKSAFELTRPEVERLRAAYAALRQLATDHPDDPRNWARQGYVHCWYCGGPQNDEVNAGPEIHGGWHFLPWHRAYLYFQERILARLINDDTFALPYWDWDSEGRQAFPSVYGDPHDPSNPLFDLLRSAKAAQAMRAQIVGATVLNRTMNAPTNRLFLGWQDASSSTAIAGAIENQPHGPVHVWTGDTTLQEAKSHMGILATAALDPIFFAHHNNIDRLWSVWLGLSPDHENFSSPAWLATTWSFYNEDGNWTQIALSDTLDMVKSLRYQYQPPSTKPVWTFRKRPSRVARAMEASPALMFAQKPTGIEQGPAPVTYTVPLPPRLADAFRTLSDRSAPEYVLHIEGIHVRSHRQALLHIYLNLPTATAQTGTDVPTFVGTVTVLARHAKEEGHRRVSINAAFDVTSILGQVTKGKTLAVTLVPFATEGQAPKQLELSFKRIYIQSF